MNNSRTSLFNELVFSFFSFISLVFFTYGQKFIPEYFSWDSITIRNAMSGGIGGYYGNAAKLYQLLGFNKYSPEIYIEILSWIIYIVTLVIIFRISNYNIVDPYKIILIFLYTIIYGCYYATFSKDLILVFFTVIIAFLYIKTNKYFFMPILFFAYGYWYRQYWEIIAAMVFIFVIIKFKKLKVGFIIMNTVFVIILYDLMLDSYITNTRVSFNFLRTANSMINNLVINTSIFTDIINYIYSLISMIIPIQGIGSFNQIFYYLWIWFIIYVFFKKKDSINIIFVHVILIYFSIQACFEPDLGSALRHMFSIFLIIYMSIFVDEK